ncbi:mg2+ transporter protein CorA-like protein [Acetobacter sp. CAG:977]|nr:mg2+ transporter protein CorA-like protein [Acetobacter sp. CAG:977]
MTETPFAQEENHDEIMADPLMHEREWLLYAIVLDGEGGGKSLDESELNQWKPEDGTLWLHLDLSVEGTHDWMLNCSHIDPLVLEALLEDEEPRPRCMPYGDNLLLFLRAINLNPGEEPDDMISLRIWCEKNRIITLRETPLSTMREIDRKLMTGVGPKTTGEMLDEVCSTTLDRIVAAVADVECLIDNIEDKIVDEDDDDDMMAPLSEARRKLSEMRRYLSPQRDAMEMLPRQLMSWLDKEIQYQLRENANRMLRIIEDIDSLRERASINMDELSSQLREETQENMYMLSVLAAIFIPLTFITGLLGMNVGGIPFAEHEHGFLIVTGLMFLFGVILMIIFKRLKWY